MTDQAGTPQSSPLELLDAARFSPLVDDTFDVGIDGNVVATPTQLVLKDVVETTGSPDSSRRIPFTLTFTGPAGDHLPQGLYELTHPTLGAVEIFLVPIGPRDDGRHRYEAVFN